MQCRVTRDFFQLCALDIKTPDGHETVCRIELLCDLRWLTGALNLKGSTTTVDGKAKFSVKEALKMSGVRVNCVASFLKHYTC